MFDLTADDYRLMLEIMAGQVAETWRQRFLELGHSRIEEAVRHKKGARFLEEVLLSAIVEERGSLVNFVPTTTSSEPIKVDNNDEPELDIF